MTNKNLLVPGIIYLKDYSVCFLTKGDITRMDEGFYDGTYLPIPLDKKHLLILGFMQCHDNFKRGFYFKGYGLNIWYDNDISAYCYRGREIYFSFKYLHSLQHFLINLCGLSNIDFGKLVEPIDEYYKTERSLIKMTVKERQGLVDNSEVLGLRIFNKKN